MAALQNITDDLAKKHGVTQDKAKAIVKDYMESVARTVCETGEFQVKGFGIWKLKVRKGVNATGGKFGPVVTGPFNVLHFKPYFKLPEVK